jgi:ribosomal protein S18 acetylase RimI-like enzyme
MPTIEIKPIAPQETYPVRRDVLRPHQALEEQAHPGDDTPQALHVGAFENGALVGVASVSREGYGEWNGADVWKLRGMATRPEVRGKGYGGQILRRCIAHVAAHGGRVLWCNAREDAIGFYQHLGFALTGEVKRIAGRGGRYVMWRRVAPADVSLFDKEFHRHEDGAD